MQIFFIKETVHLYVSQMIFNNSDLELILKKVQKHIFFTYSDIFVMFLTLLYMYQLYLKLFLYIFSEMFDLKTKYEESDHIVIRATRTFTDKMSEMFGKHCGGLKIGL